MTAVEINDNGNGHSSFSGCNGNNKNGKKYSVQFIRPEVFIEGDKIQVHAVQNKLNGHQQGDHISAGQEAINANKEERNAYKQDMI